MGTFTLEFTASQMRDLLTLVDQANAKAIDHAKELSDDGKHKAAQKMNGYSDRLMTILDILEPAVAAIDVSGR
jgi:hypothetical protein